MKKIVIHLGFPKSGSTFLQKNIFSHIKETFPIDQINNREYYESIIIPILEASPHSFYKHVENIKYLIDAIDSNTILLSDESFIYGREKYSPNNYETIIQRLNLLFPNALYLVVIRNQTEVIQSMYSQIKKTNYFIKSFDKWLVDEREKFDIGGGILTRFQYHEILLTICKHIDRNKLIILQQEKIPIDELKKVMLRHFGLTLYDEIKNERINERTTYLYAFTNAIYKKYFKSIVGSTLRSSIKNNRQKIEKLLSSGKKIEVQCSQENYKFLRDFYSNSNRVLEIEFDLTLNKKYFNK